MNDIFFENTGGNLELQFGDVIYNENVEGTFQEPVLYDVPGVGKIVVSGDPYELGDQLDDKQGDNIYNFGGDCGLVSVTNILKMAGIDATEDEVVDRAIDLGLTSYSCFNPPEENGGTTAYERASLLRTYGINCSVLDEKNGTASLDSLAELVENGHGVNISINAGYAWNDPYAVQDGSSNHSIIVTGTARDPETGNLIGLYVCDSGLTEKDSGSILLTVDQLEDCYVNVPGTCAVVTNDEIR